ncbi:hypothetical protein Bca52824_001133 [Brassica carinata]|uniref:Uncharacterized protein n=1 Tax=Brassica carinata TaxID=52824 RepID=A0A8X7WKX8_BRACI|nr:hypothetical protein Bca52824_001133 [Brassica carinata]
MFRSAADPAAAQQIRVMSVELLVQQPGRASSGSPSQPTTGTYNLTVPKRKGGRLVGLARRASSFPASSSQVLYADPMILEQLQNKDEWIVALEEQNATILAEWADEKTNTEILERLDRLFPSVLNFF